ncbi:DNA mismatch repair protein MutL [Anaerosolibacter carboniphilus]|uniref:DNA mismatch repair protein MutL n=1 Tax=Anaerosolibacter carboniphilus TaxID=1417629 RepID=A0A841KTF3_9FIRM|nr:DNA mismatch repair endonuclease MutL [Anaerosolibacter carboniphilus]MBB6216697.1 DNA mismatch repair protein MutL [Anaerosolibacter carboniphilus]
MNNRIIKLDPLTANKIAAGEVVDRPASVVKELVENAIDAQATSIVVEIREGGKTFIRVTDNGSGIDETDIELAFERHATSKLRNIEDLNTILSLGFRGEALASISSVSQIELVTKTETSDSGIVLELHSGKIISRNRIGTTKGTTFVIKNLFYNTPARLKFMKSSSTEAAYINDVVSRLAMAHPNIAVRFINNESIIFSTSGSGNVIHNIASIYGKELAKNIYHFKKEHGEISLEAFVAKPSFHRGNRQLQSFFINGRYIKSLLLQNSVEEAYRTLLPINKYPICFLYLTMSPELIDVNIHPTKLEIKFSNDEILKPFITRCIKEALYRQNLIPEVSFETTKVKDNSLDNVIDLLPLKETTQPFIEKSNVIIKKQVEDKFPVFTNNKVEQKNDFPKVHEEQMIFESSVPSPTPTNHQGNFSEKLPIENIKISDITIIGQLFHTYLVGEYKEALFLIDQHAAHERIIFEWMLNRFRSRSVMVQQLLVPIVVELTLGEWSAVMDNHDLLSQFGFEVEDFGQHTVLIRSVPMIMGEPEAKSFFHEIVDHFVKEHFHITDYKIDKIIAMACKEAIKAKDKLDTIEMHELLKQLEDLENPYTCPHGRPIIVSISKYEIEKKFKRV